MNYMLIIILNYIILYFTNQNMNPQPRKIYMIRADEKYPLYRILIKITISLRLSLENIHKTCVIIVSRINTW